MKVGKFTEGDWSQIELVVFDVDGTLYRQRPVRLAMAAALALHVVRTGSFREAQAIARFRRIREQLCDDCPEDFEARLYEYALTTMRMDRPAVERLVSEWIERRPLNHLKRARVAGVEGLFDRLRRSGRKIGVWSDYPVPDKLDALGLHADYVAAATDPHIACLKPLPVGLQHIMAAAGARPDTTLMIGDRRERDGEAARRAGVPALVRSRKACPKYANFQRYDDPIFRPVLDS